MKTFYVKFPGNFHPISFQADNEQEARALARAFLSAGKRKYKRLPNGTDVYEFTALDQRIVQASVSMMRADYAKAGQIFD